jgi:hypothetical protein
MATDDHFEQAVSGVNQKALHIPVQLVAANSRQTSQAESSAHEKPPESQGFATSGELTREDKMAGTGFEPATSRL